jgi:ABC-type Na+ efflux pump permease subunit
MNRRAMKAIVRKDLKVVWRSRAVLVPLIIVPLILLVILPAVGGLILSHTDPSAPSITDFRRQSATFFSHLPPVIANRLGRFDNEVQRITYIMFNLLFPALYLILPTMVASVIAADSFAGEKERKTLEALAYTPTTDRELYLAKLLGPWIAGITVGWLGYLAFAAVITATTYRMMGEAFVLDPTWLMLIVWVVPAAAGLGLGVMVLVSSRVSTFQEAYQLGGMVVLPLVALLLGQIRGVIYLSPMIAAVVGAVLWALTGWMIWYGASTFKRGELIARL